MQKRLGKDADEAAASGSQMHPEDELYAVPSDLQVFLCHSTYCSAMICPVALIKQLTAHSRKWPNSQDETVHSTTAMVEQCCKLCMHCMAPQCHFSRPLLSRGSQLQGQSTKAQDPGAWATGIVEVALPVEYKMQNIEETEAAKRRLLHASR